MSDQKRRNRWGTRNFGRVGRLAKRVLVSWIGLQLGAKTPESHCQNWRFLGRFR